MTSNNSNNNNTNNASFQRKRSNTVVGSTLESFFHNQQQQMHSQCYYSHNNNKRHCYSNHHYFANETFRRNNDSNSNNNYNTTTNTTCHSSIIHQEKPIKRTSSFRDFLLLAEDAITLSEVKYTHNNMFMNNNITNGDHNGFNSQNIGNATTTINETNRNHYDDDHHHHQSNLTSTTNKQNQNTNNTTTTTTTGITKTITRKKSNNSNKNHHQSVLDTNYLLLPSSSAASLASLGSDIYCSSTLTNHYSNQSYENNMSRSSSNATTTTTTTTSSSSSSSHHKKICRICLSEDENVKFISPCLCMGSSRYVHANCINKWRTLSQNPQSKIQCDVCKAYYRFQNGCIINGTLSLESAKLMSFLCLLAYYTSVIFFLAYLTLIIVSSLKLPPLKHFYWFQDLHIFQYWPGFYLLGAYSKWRLNNLFTSVFLVSVISLMGRVNAALGLIADLYWTFFLIYGLCEMFRTIKWKTDIVGPKLYMLLVDMKSNEDLASC